MSNSVPVHRQPLGPIENAPIGSWLERRKGRNPSQLLKPDNKKKPTISLPVTISTGAGDISVYSPEKEGDQIQVLARIQKIVDKSDLEIVLAFPVLEKGGTIDTFASCQVSDYGNKKEGEVMFQGKKISARDLGKYIMKDSSVMASVYWRSSRVVSKGKRWKVAKFWKPNPNNNVNIYSVVAV